MARKPLPVARARVSIGSATTTYTQAALAADTYVRIGGIRNIGGFGDTAQAITVDEVDDGRTRKAKGTRNAGTMELLCSLVVEDEGQIAANEAASGDDAMNFRVELPRPGGTFATYYLSALVMSNNIGLGGPNDTQTITFTLEVDEESIAVVTP